MRPPGEHAVIWNGTDGNGDPVPGGIYFVYITAGNQKAVEKLVLIR